MSLVTPRQSSFAALSRLSPDRDARPKALEPGTSVPGQPGQSVIAANRLEEDGSPAGRGN